MDNRSSSCLLLGASSFTFFSPFEGHSIPLHLAAGPLATAPPIRLKEYLGSAAGCLMYTALSWFIMAPRGELGSKYPFFATLELPFSDGNGLVSPSRGELLSYKTASSVEKGSWNGIVRFLK